MLKRMKEEETKKKRNRLNRRKHRKKEKDERKKKHLNDFFLKPKWKREKCIEKKCFSVVAIIFRASIFFDVFIIKIF